MTDEARNAVAAVHHDLPHYRSSSPKFSWKRAKLRICSIPARARFPAHSGLATRNQPNKSLNRRPPKCARPHNQPGNPPSHPPRLRGVPCHDCRRRPELSERHRFEGKRCRSLLSCRASRRFRMSRRMGALRRDPPFRRMSRGPVVRCDARASHTRAIVAVTDHHVANAGERSQNLRHRLDNSIDAPRYSPCTGASRRATREGSAVRPDAAGVDVASLGIENSGSSAHGSRRDSLRRDMLEARRL